MMASEWPRCSTTRARAMRNSALMPFLAGLVGKLFDHLVGRRHPAHGAHRPRGRCGMTCSDPDRDTRVAELQRTLDELRGRLADLAMEMAGDPPAAPHSLFEGNEQAELAWQMAWTAARAYDATLLKKLLAAMNANGEWFGMSYPDPDRDQRRGLDGE